MLKFGFKQIDTDNWLQPDEAISFFTGMENSDEYVRAVLAPKLSENVPQDVQALFEVARGALLYGYLFYPLYALATDHLFRVGEGAIVHKCSELGMPKEKKRFVDRVNWLVQKGVLSAEEGEHWHTLRGLRNSASHVTTQSILSPGTAIGTLDQVAQDINALFEEGTHRSC